jgi:hypothetical protein
MKNIFILLLFLSSLKGYGQTDAIPNVKFKVATIGLLDSLFGEPEISVTNGSFGTKFYIDTLRFLGHLSDEYLNDHGYYREKPGYLTRNQYKDILNLPGTQPPTINDLMYAPERDHENKLKATASELVELYDQYKVECKADSLHPHYHKVHRWPESECYYTLENCKVQYTLALEIYDESRKTDKFYMDYDHYLKGPETIIYYSKVPTFEGFVEFLRKKK